MTSLIEQRTKSDCVLCCIAMVLGLTYEQAAEKAGVAFVELMNSDRGCDDKMEMALYKAMGLVKDKDFQKLHIAIHWTNVSFVRTILWGRPALLSVRSRNNADGWHKIYWTGTEIRDPSTKDKYTKWEEVEPSSVVIFNNSRD